MAAGLESWENRRKVFSFYFNLTNAWSWEPGTWKLEVRGPALRGSSPLQENNSNFCQLEGGIQEDCSGAGMDERDLARQSRAKGIPGRGQKRQRPRGGRDQSIFGEVLMR